PVVLLGRAGVAVGMEGAEWAGLGAAWIVGALLWLLGSSAAISHRPGAPAPVVARTVAFAGLALGIGVSTLGGGVIDDRRAPAAALEGTLLGSVGLAHLVLVLGVVAVHLSTANIAVRLVLDSVGVPADRKSTRLNSSHVKISYAVFCLKKKKTKKTRN